MKYFTLTFALIIWYSTSSYGQNQILIDDQDGIINAEVDTLLSKKLEAQDYELTYLIDYKNKCNYLFSTISQKAQGYYIKLENCEDDFLGELFLGSNLKSVSNEEKAIIIYYNLWELIKNPRAEEGQTEEIAATASNQGPETINAEHDSRYFFAPSAFPLKKDELYYNSLYFLLHDFQYGVSDKVTLGMGTTIIGLPLYFTVKVSLPIAEKSNIAFGNMFIVGTYGTEFFGNLAFGTYTYGDQHNNVSIGGGHLYFNDDNLSTGVLNLSGIKRMGRYFYFLTENYYGNSKIDGEAFRNTFLADGTVLWQSESFQYRQHLWYGMTGVRFVRRANELVSWQVGITHLLLNSGEIPERYNTGNWNTDRGISNLIAFPSFGFTRKFKL